MRVAFNSRLQLVADQAALFCVLLSRLLSNNYKRLIGGEAPPKSREHYQQRLPLFEAIG